MRVPFDPDFLDAEDPFEIDEGNRPHLFKHLPAGSGGRPVGVDAEDLLDLYVVDNPVFVPADPEKGDADWIMLGEIPGAILSVPLAPANSGSAARCRPIGIHTATADECRTYLEGLDER